MSVSTVAPDVVRAEHLGRAIAALESARDTIAALNRQSLDRGSHTRATLEVRRTEQLLAEVTS